MFKLNKIIYYDITKTLIVIGLKGHMEFSTVLLCFMLLVYIIMVCQSSGKYVLE